MLPEKKRFCLPDWPICMAILAAVCLVVSLVRFYAGNLCGLLFTTILAPLSLCGVGLLVFRTNLFRQRSFQLLLAVFAVFFLSIVLNEKFYGTLLQNRSYFDALVIYVFVCFPLGFILSEKARGKALHVLIGLSVGIIAVFCLVGIVAAASGAYLTNSFTDYGIGISPDPADAGAYQRLAVLCYPNAVGMMSCIALLLALYEALTTKKRFCRALYIVAGCICYIALALTVSRASMFAASLGLGLYAFRFAMLHLPKKWRWCRTIAAILLAALVLAVGYFGFRPVAAGVNQMAAGVSSSAITEVAERPVSNDIGNLTGRTTLWRAALQSMLDTPRLFLLGVSPCAVGQQTAPYLASYGIWYQELHNSYIQILYSCGLPCLLLFAVFLFLLVWQSGKGFFSQSVAMYADGYLPIPLVAILAIAVLETFLLIYQDLYFANLWMFILAGYIFGGKVGQK